jgi:AraC-like DNA-binding protein
MIETLGFLPPPPGSPSAVLGVVASRACQGAGGELVVPAHALATLNWVLGGSLHRVAHGARQRLPAAFATGAHAQHRRYWLDGRAVLVSALLRADAQPADWPTRSVNQWLPADALFDWAPCARASASDTWAQHAQSLMGAALRRAAHMREADYAPIRRALHALLHHSVAQAAALLACSERALERLFAQAWGLSPKRVQRMVRIQQGLQAWHGDNAPQNLAELAAHCGLADQAHLAREFRELIGHVPRVLKSGGVELAPQMLVFRQTWAAFV